MKPVRHRRSNIPSLDNGTIKRIADVYTKVMGKIGEQHPTVAFQSHPAQFDVTLTKEPNDGSVLITLRGTTQPSGIIGIMEAEIWRLCKDESLNLVITRKGEQS